jgi:hypothetical protein
MRFLHAWLKIRERAKHLRELFAEASRQVWEADHAPDRRRFEQRLRRLRQWSGQHLSGNALEKVLDLSGNALEKVLDLRAKRPRWSLAYRHPDGHRMSNMLDRVMRGMTRSFEDGQHPHGSREASRRHCRAWALLWNFAPWSPATTRDHNGWRSPA